jgi:Lhr-like helicase
MQTPQETLTAMQTQAIEAIKSGQTATLEAVQAWRESVAKVTPQTAPVPEVPAEFTQAIGDPAEIVDSVYDFAGQLLELNKEFVHKLLAAAQPATK